MVDCLFFSNSARFLWKSIPLEIKESRPEIVAVWKIGQCLWTRDYAGVYNAIRGFDWSAEIAGMVVAFSGGVSHLIVYYYYYYYLCALLNYLEFLKCGSTNSLLVEIATNTFI